MVRQVKFGMAAAVVLAVLGLPLGWLWRSISPHVSYVIIQHVKYLADPEGTGSIGTDGRFAVIALVTGICSGVVGYLLAGRNNELGLLVGVGAGGVAGSLVAWAVGSLPGRSHFDHLVNTLADGKTATTPPHLSALGVLVIWPLLALVVFAFLEATDIARRHTFHLPDGPQATLDGRLQTPNDLPLMPGDLGGDGVGESDQVGGSKLDLQAAPPGRDVDGRQP